MFAQMSSGWPSWLSPGQRVLHRLSLPGKLALIMGLPLLGLVWSVGQMGVHYLHERQLHAERLEGIDAMASVQAAQISLHQHWRRATLPAEIAGAAVAVPRLRPLPTEWALESSQKPAAACLAQLMSQHEVSASMTDLLVQHSACDDHLDRLSQAIALRSGLLRTELKEGYLLADFWVHHLGPLQRAAAKVSALLGRPNAPAHLVPENMASWTQPGGNVQRLLAAAEARRTQAEALGYPLPPGLPHLEKVLQNQADAIQAKLALGDLVPAAELPERHAAWQATEQAMATFAMTLQQQLRSTVQASFNTACQVLLVEAVLASLMLMTAVYLALACAAGFLGQVSGIRRCVEAHTHGQLDVRVPVLARDELGMIANDMNVMGDRLGALVAQLRGSSDEIAGLGDTLSMGAQSLAIRTEQQARELDESTHSVQSVAHSASQCADLAAQVQQVSHTLQSQARQGASEVGQAVQGMEDIARQAEQMRESMGAIASIAMQTRLLSLNATVEAAHAGPHGRGFALVAGEVRSLADRTAEVAQQMQMMIDQSGHAIDRSLHQVRRIESLSRDVEVHSVDTAERMQSIAMQSAAQSAAMDQVRIALADLAAITHANLDMVTESVGEAERIRGCSEDLAAAVRHLQGEAA